MNSTGYEIKWGSQQLSYCRPRECIHANNIPVRDFLWPRWHNVRKVNEQWWFHQRLKDPEQSSWPIQRNETFLMNSVGKSLVCNTLKWLYIPYVSSTSVWVSWWSVHRIGGRNEANTKTHTFFGSSSCLFTELQVRTSVLWADGLG